jgi:hypothetical protein
MHSCTNIILLLLQGSPSPLIHAAQRNLSLQTQKQRAAEVAIRSQIFLISSTLLQCNAICEVFLYPLQVFTCNLQQCVRDLLHCDEDSFFEFAKKKERRREGKKMGWRGLSAENMRTYFCRITVHTVHG